MWYICAQLKKVNSEIPSRVRIRCCQKCIIFKHSKSYILGAILKCRLLNINNLHFRSNSKYRLWKSLDIVEFAFWTWSILKFQWNTLSFLLRLQPTERKFSKVNQVYFARMWKRLNVGKWLLAPQSTLSILYSIFLTHLHRVLPPKYLNNN